MADADVFPKRRLALKTFIAMRTADEEHARRFLRGMQLSMRVAHPSVVTVVECGWWQERTPFIVWSPQRPAPPTVSRATVAVGRGEAVQMLSLLDGLGAIHGGDMSCMVVFTPDNILRLADGTIRILDFGLSTRSGLKPLTPSGISLGDLPTWCPSRSQRRHHLDARADLYSAGHCHL